MVESGDVINIKGLELKAGDTIKFDGIHTFRNGLNIDAYNVSRRNPTLIPGWNTFRSTKLMQKSCSSIKNIICRGDDMTVLLKTLQGYGQNLPVETELNIKLSDTDSTLTIVIDENKGTFDAIGAITKMWTITGVAGPEDENEYRIVMLDKETRGQKVD